MTRTRPLLLFQEKKGGKRMSVPILMTEAAWRNSYFSVSRFYGGIRIMGHEYIITEAGDLLRRDFLKFYKKMGREEFIEVLEDHIHDGDYELKEVFKKVCSTIK